MTAIALGLLLLLVTTLPTCRDASEPGAGHRVDRRLPLWRIDRPGSGPDAPAVHLLATVPVHDTTRLRFAPEIEAAFASARRLVLPSDAPLTPHLEVAGWKAHLEEGDTLARWIGPDLHAAYTAAIGRGGFPPGTAEVTAPWFAARVVAGADYRRTDTVDASEIALYLAHRARWRTPPLEVVTLETSAEGYDRYAALDREVQIALLGLALARSDDADERLAGVQAAWQTGDVETLAAWYAAGTPDRAAALYATVGAEAAIVEAALERSLDEPGDTFCAVPAALLFGDSGLLARLAQRGLRVEQRTSATAEGTLAEPAPDDVPALPASEPADPGRHRVLVVGIDGASLRVIEPLLERGRLPALARLAAEGAHGPLRAHQPIHSPRIWASIATGKTPEHHGIRGFRYRDAQGRDRLYLSRHRKAHALWNVFSAAGFDVGVVNWWNTWPPELVRGVMVSDHAVPTRLDAEDADAVDLPGDLDLRETVYPPEWSTRVAAAMADHAPLTPVGDPFLGVVGIPSWMHRELMSKRFHDDATITRIALDVDRSEAPDLLMVFLPGIDRVSHRAWGALEPQETYPPNLRLTPSQLPTVRAALERYYEYTDALIALLLARFDDDDLVLVLSDHGFEAGEKLAGLTGTHEGEAAIDGVLFARGPGIAKGASTAGTSVNDITPTVLAWRGLALARDFDGRVASFLDPPVPQPPSIATWDEGVIERLEVGESGSEAEILERLRALGYIE